MAEFLMPSLGADMDSGTLVEWSVAPGDRVHRGDLVAAVETEKSVIDVECFEDGVVERLLVPVGTTVPVGTPLRIVGLVCIVGGMVSAFGTMLWFGLRRALGLRVDALVQAGPYQLTRNPQIVSGALMVIGTVVLWPSWYALGWAVLYGFVAHMMVLSEEEHLREVHGDKYVRYCTDVPRYLRLRQRS